MIAVQEKLFMKPMFTIKRDFYKQLNKDLKLSLKIMLDENGIDNVLIVGDEKRQYTIRTHARIKKGEV